jgi:hypothetical protein
MTSQLNLLLDTYHTNTLREMAAAADLKTKDSRGKQINKTELLALMLREFFTPERVLASLAKLNDRERAVLNRLLLHGGEASTRLLRRELARAGITTEPPTPPQSRPGKVLAALRGFGHQAQSVYFGDPNRTKSTIFEDVLTRLTLFGLVFGTNVRTSGAVGKLNLQPGVDLFIPPAIRTYLPEPDPIAAKATAWKPAHLQTGDPNLLLRDLYLYWDFVRKNSVDILQSGLVGKRSLKAINLTLLTPDPHLADASTEAHVPRLHLLRLILESLGLLHRDHARLVSTTAASTDIPTFWTLPTATQITKCLEAWLPLPHANELGRSAEQYAPNYAPARKELLALVKKQAAHNWIERDELLAQLQDWNINFLFPHHRDVENSRSEWYNNYHGVYFYGKRQDLLDTMDKLEAQFVHKFLTELLFPLGMIDLGYEDQDNQNYAIRLTPSGQVALGLLPPEKAPAPFDGKVVIQPNFHVLAMGPVSLQVLAGLDLFTERRQADRGAFEYQITRDSIYRALQQGLPLNDIIRQLTDLSGQELPQNVYRSLQEWGAHHERIVFRTGVNLLQAATAEMLTSLANSPDINPFLARSLTPEVALVSPHQMAGLVGALTAQNILPVISDDRPEAADHSAIIQADGVIRPIHAVPSLHLNGRLARLAEEKTDGRWQLTEKSMRKVGGNKKKVLRILEELTSLQRGPLPPEIETRVKAWGSYYGDAAAETLTLIEFRDAEIMAEILQHPPLQGWLAPFPTADRALAVVAGDNLAQVNAVLAELGVSVKDSLAR